MWRLCQIIILAALLRLVLLLYGLYQDANSSISYTDIDYLVFTDAARYVSIGESPYKRETYRYTPLLAWLLLPTTWPGQFWFAFGKILFALADLGAGYLLYRILRFEAGLSDERALKFASVWLLNPMVAIISTRGSSEGLLGLLVIALLWSAMGRRALLTGFLLGLSVHVKIYPFIYAPSLLLFFETKTAPAGASLFQRMKNFVNRDRVMLTFASWATFTILNAAMYSIYGREFVQHTFLHHLTRIDHRHNFSPYNMMLYASSAKAADPMASASAWATKVESLAFVPQLSLSAVLIPLALAKKHLPTAMLAQTLAFVTFNKVCTSQYFLWYLVLLPLYLPYSSWLQPITNPSSGKATSTRATQPSMLRRYMDAVWTYRAGLIDLLLWIGGQALWLQQAYQLEFLGQSAFVPGIWAACLVFYAINISILGTIISDASCLAIRSRV